jgi:hypothetical protein
LQVLRRIPGHQYAPTLAAVAAALPPEGAQFAPWDGPAALIRPTLLCAGDATPAGA